MATRDEQRSIVGELIIGHGKDKKPYASWRCRCGVSATADTGKKIDALLIRYEKHKKCREKPMTAWVYDLDKNILRAD